MALSDCVDCWETPCVCGKYWKEYNNDKLVDYILTVVAKKSRQDALLILRSVLEIKYNE